MTPYFREEAGEFVLYNPVAVGEDTLDGTIPSEPERVGVYDTVEELQDESMRQFGQEAILF